MKKISLLLAAVGFVFIFSACSKDKPTPQERFKSYLSNWQDQNFQAMYQALSKKAKHKISQKKFVNRYKNIYHDFEISDLEVTPDFKKPKDKKKIDPDGDSKVRLPFTVKMNTLAGPVKFTEKATILKETHKNDKGDKTKNWYVKWNTKMIFPQMTSPKIEVHAKTLPAHRGKIIGRNGHLLAGEGEVASIGIWPGKLKKGATKKLSKITGIPLKTINAKLNQSWVKDGSFVPILQLPLNQKKKINKIVSLHGVLEQKGHNYGFIYPLQKAAGHLTGYTGPISADQLKKLKDKGYNENSVIGKSGLEAIFEDKLRARDGSVIYTTDQNGNKLKTIAKKPPKNGETIQLTIDAALQKKLYHELAKDGDVGTAAAIDPITGEILALVSTPSYDPNKIHQNFQELSQNPDHPLLNRFTQAYAPGSTFKPITAAIALKTDSIDPNKERQISGQDWQPNDPAWGDYHVHRVDTLPEVDLKSALIRSDNIYFAQTALKIGAEDFLKQAKNFGFGEKLPSFPFQVEPAQITNDGNFDGTIQLANSGYGQAQVQTSALQLAIAYTPFVNSGNLIKPTLVMSEANNGSQIWHKDVISTEIANRIEQDLVQVVSSPFGTGHAAELKGYTIAGKTGTAELDQKKNGKENGWFIAFNTKQPKIMIAMMVHNVQNKNPSGSHYVVPKVADALQWYLKK
ncbi:MAG TPA: penicillin-binding transpeptidase domain-containing protein [Bacillales bacterium]|nr:penicillin-binding transpeptidase domain-containing protein [Bacillales bacterium]